MNDGGNFSVCPGALKKSPLHAAHYLTPSRARMLLQLSRRRRSEKVPVVARCSAFVAARVRCCIGSAARGGGARAWRGADDGATGVT